LIALATPTSPFEPSALRKLRDRKVEDHEVRCLAHKMHYGHLPPRRAGGDDTTPVRQRFYAADDSRPQPANVVKVQQKIKTDVLDCQAQRITA
jgi:hypothetical protein